MGRMQSKLQSHFGCSLQPTGAMLFWLSADEESSLAAAGRGHATAHSAAERAHVDLAAYSTPHVDQVNVRDYEISSLLYLNAMRDGTADDIEGCLHDDDGDDDDDDDMFEGGWFAFNDPDHDVLVAPRRGRLLGFTSGFENLHQVTSTVVVVVVMMMVSELSIVIWS
jgi:hypothetical protein